MGETEDARMYMDETLKLTLLVILISLSGGFREFLPCQVMKRVQKSVAFNLLVLFLLTSYVLRLDMPDASVQFTLLVSLLVTVLAYLLSKQMFGLFAILFAAIYIYYYLDDADNEIKDYFGGGIAIVTILGLAGYLYKQKNDKGNLFKLGQFLFQPTANCDYVKQPVSSSITQPLSPQSQNDERSVSINMSRIEDIIRGNILP